MAFNLILFYVFAAIAVGTTLLVVVQSNPVYSVLLLIGSFIGLAGLYVLLDAPFVAVIQIIVYAGAIMVLFLFVVMLLNAPREEIVQSGMLASERNARDRRPSRDRLCRGDGVGADAIANAVDVCGGWRDVVFGAADRPAFVPGVCVRVRSDVDPHSCGDGGRDYARRPATWQTVGRNFSCASYG